MSMEGVLDLAMDEEVEKVLSTHKQILDTHEDKIQELQIKSACFVEKFNNLDIIVEDIKTTLSRMETNNLQNTNSMMSIMSQIVLNTNNNNTDIAKTKNNNNTKVVLKVLAIVGGAISAIIIGYFALKGVTIPAM